MSAAAAKKITGKFLNVDLEIESSSNLDSLAAEMGKRVSILHSGPGSRAKYHFLSAEVRQQHKNPDSTIKAFCDIVEKFSPPTRRIWNSARKEFNIGYELRPDEQRSEFSLSAETLRRVVETGAGLGVTYYRGEMED